MADKIYTEHTSVLLNESLDYLFENVKLESDRVFYFADLTFGGGGHSLAIVTKSKKIKLVSFDQDPDAIANGRCLIEKGSLNDQLDLIYSNYENFKEIVDQKYPNIEGFDGIMMDLGVSSHHFDSGERGFSFNSDAELDMRMNYSDETQVTAKEIVNTYSEEQLVNIFIKYGEEKFSRRIAKAIVEKRAESLITRTKELENIIFHSYPKNLRYKRQNPSTKVFQALRLEVNREMEVLENSLEKIASKLNAGGRLVVISFHSIEDRVVKHKFKAIAVDKKYKIITKRPIAPSESEININKRSRSAKMRVIEKIG